MLRSCLTTCLFALAAGFAPTLRRQPPKMPLRTAAPRLCAADDVSKNLLFDTIDVENRPSLLAALEARDYLTIAFLAHGAYVSGLNIAGAYEGYTEQAIGVAAILGFLSAAWGWWSLLSGGIEEDNRPGFARERTIMWYTSTYLAGVMWLSVRLSLLTFKTAVPLYGFGVLPVLTLLPMGCLFWWQRADVSFWSFLFM